MRVAFVTPRYGLEVVGGAETAARQFAEHLVAECGVEVEAFSTCALDHITWEDVLAPGDSELRGVRVHRFRSAAGRSKGFYALDGRLRSAPARATRREADRWVDLNGPVTPALVEAVCDSGADVVAFYPYLYYPTVRAIGRAPMPAVLHPAAHDEPALYLPVFADTFSRADALVFQTMAERRVVQRVHRVAAHFQVLLGLGITDPLSRRRPGAEAAGIGERPYVVSVGRVDAHKGSQMLAGFFARYKARHPGPLAMVFVGPVACEMPEHPDIVLTGAASEQDKYDILRDAQVSISGSALEAFSLVVPESWTLGLPVVVNARCGATREHCERSGGGLWFGSYREFEVVMDRLLGDAGLRRTLGERGSAYVSGHFRWPTLIARYARFLSRVAERGKVGRRG